VPARALMTAFNVTGSDALLTAVLVRRMVDRNRD